MGVKERIIQYADLKGISKRAFGLKIGASGSFVSNISNSIGPDKINMIRQVYPDLNIGWIITGFGEMINDGNKPEENNNQLNPTAMDAHLTTMDYIAALKDQIQMLKDQVKVKDDLIRKLTEQSDDKSVSRRLGAVKEEQDKLDY